MADAKQNCGADVRSAWANTVPPYNERGHICQQPATPILRSSCCAFGLQSGLGFLSHFQSEFFGFFGACQVAGSRDLTGKFLRRLVSESPVRPALIVQPRALTPIKLSLEKCAMAGTRGRAGRSPCGAFVSLFHTNRSLSKVPPHRVNIGCPPAGSSCVANSCQNCTECDLPREARKIITR
jgi:hypothetical protein